MSLYLAFEKTFNPLFIILFSRLTRSIVDARLLRRRSPIAGLSSRSAIASLVIYLPSGLGLDNGFDITVGTNI